MERGGLELVAEEGLGQNRNSAAAALGIPTACDAAVSEFLEGCR